LCNIYQAVIPAVLSQSFLDRQATIVIYSKTGSRTLKVLFPSGKQFANNAEEEEK